MNLETTLYYFTHHSETIIQWLFLVILLISAYVIGRTIFAKKEAAGPMSATNAVFADGSDVQVFLKKILDQTSKLETVKLEGMSPKAMGEVEAQVQTLKKELQQREEELTKLKSADGKAADPGPLSTRIKELESKLAEYEILEDDIADLSLYKEENVRLRSELEKIKGGAPAPAPVVPAESGEDIVAEFAQAVNQDVVASAPTVAAAADTGNPMADFENAVKLEKKVQGDAAPAQFPIAAVPSHAPTFAMAPASAAPADAATTAAEGDDLFAEFANPVAEVEDGALDTDKMMAEMAALVSLEPSKDTALGEEIDTEKMAAEATSLTKA